MAEIVQLTTTVDSRERAAELAAALVDERLAACAQVAGPVESHYRWQGKATIATEWYCHFKTTKQLADRARNRVVQLHPYEVPEVIEVPVGGHAAYIDWVVRQCSSR